MNQRFQLVVRNDDKSTKVLETVSSREEAEYAMCEYHIRGIVDLSNLEIVEVNNHVTSIKE